MTQKRIVALFGTFLVAFGVVMGRLFLLAQNTTYAQTAREQTVTTLALEPQRGNLYDCKGSCLTSYGTRYFALSIPGESSYAELFHYVPYSSQTLLYEKRNALAPFLIEVDRDLTDKGIYTYTVPGRYFPTPVAEHLIGYLDGEGHGVAGLEAAFDELLSQNRPASYVQCSTTAQGTLLAGTEPELITEQKDSQGVMLTLDGAMQRACEGVAASTIKKGCILVLDTATAKVRASVSLPAFDPEAVEKSIRAQDTSLLNRAFCQFNVGSVFKPVLAAAALEKGLDWYSIECEGYVDVNGQVYRCALSRAHGLVNLKSALEKSCNSFFIELGLKLGGKAILSEAEAFGFGQPTYLAGGLKSAAGTLPSAETVQDIGQLANFSFGQGQLTATPLQMAAAMNVIASDGQYRTPAFLEGVVDEAGRQVEQTLYEPQVRRAISTNTAAALRSMLAGVVEEGIGKEAAPEYGAAGGKTGTAQTGVKNQEDVELMNYWFAGFWPAEAPRYTIVILQDGITEPEVSSAAVFAKVCNALYWLQEPAENS